MSTTRIPQPVDLDEIESLANSKNPGKPHYTSVYVLDLCHALREATKQNERLKAENEQLAQAILKLRKQLDGLQDGGYLRGSGPQR